MPHAMPYIISHILLFDSLSPPACNLLPEPSIHPKQLHKHFSSIVFMVIPKQKKKQKKKTHKKKQQKKKKQKKKQ